MCLHNRIKKIGVKTANFFQGKVCVDFFGKPMSTQEEFALVEADNDEHVENEQTHRRKSQQSAHEARLAQIHARHT